MNEDISRIWSAEAKAKLKQIVEEGMRITHEREALQEGLNDAIKEICEDLGLKPAILKKVIRIAHKASAHEENKTHEDIQTILEITGKTL